jgi:hypothetical protein
MTLTIVPGNRYKTRDGSITGFIRLTKGDQYTLQAHRWPFNDGHHHWTDAGSWCPMDGIEHGLDIVALHEEPKAIDPLLGVPLKTGVSFLHKPEPYVFKVGDRCVTKDGSHIGGHYLRIFTLIDVTGTSSYDVTSVDGRCWTRDFIRLATQEEIAAMDARPFKVGDKVVCIDQACAGISKDTDGNYLGRLMTLSKVGAPYGRFMHVEENNKAWRAECFRLATEDEISWACPERIKRTVFMNVYDECANHVFFSRSSADTHAAKDRRACIELEIDVPEGYGLGRWGIEAVKVKA